MYHQKVDSLCHVWAVTTALFKTIIRNFERESGSIGSKEKYEIKHTMLWGISDCVFVWDQNTIIELAALTVLL